MIIMFLLRSRGLPAFAVMAATTGGEGFHALRGGDVEFPLGLECYRERLPPERRDAAARWAIPTSTPSERRDPLFGFPFSGYPLHDDDFRAGDAASSGIL